MAKTERTHVAPDDVRKARTFLKDKKMLDIFSPKMFAAAAKETDQGLEDTLRMLARLQDGGQNAGPFPETAEAIRNEGAG